jgi:hypothetical protein
VATPKHYAVHSGPEPDCHHFDAQVNEREMREFYLPAFEACIKEAKAVSIMGVYNRTNGEPCCASPTLLEKILRQEWGFDVLFGDYNPAGRLPVTFYKSVDDLPPFEDYQLKGHTYRYFRGEPLFAFGHGLSYTTFDYSNLRLSAKTVASGETIY